MNHRLLVPLVLLALFAPACGERTETPAPSPTVTSSAATPTVAVAPSSVASGGGLSTVEIVRKLRPSVVRVQTETATLDVFGQVVPQQGVGSGFILDEQGHIATNYHVVQGPGGRQFAQRISVLLPGEEQPVDARVVGADPPTDLAVLKIDPDGRTLTPVELGSAEATEVGADVVAIGYALGLEGDPTVTRGVLSARGRVIQEDRYSIPDAIQTDAGINPGNSGGPLVDAAGRVIGINTAIVRGAQNVGFAISIDLAKPIFEQLIANGRVSRAYLGIGVVTITPTLARNLDLPVDHGVGIVRIQPEGPAASAGLRENDIIVRLDDRPVNNDGELLQFLAERKPGDVVTVTFYRNGTERTVQVTLGEQP
ncbi:MAG TPA: trypsin-like peptidase domain-containing protein [Dehalococcoidia bacterium]|nr:trypsin-like peptidase domain-containing protein [Dehalococcoidia bacterium]